MLDLSLFDGRSLAMQIQGKDMMILCCANSFAIYWEVGIGRNKDFSSWAMNNDLLWDKVFFFTFLFGLMHWELFEE